MKNLLRDINKITFYAIGNDFLYQEYAQLYEVYVNLKIDSDQEMRNMLKLFNTTLANALEYKEQSFAMFLESYAAKYDPLKPRVMQALTESFVKANL